MASMASQLIEEVIAHAQRDSLEDAREICADGTYFPNNLPKKKVANFLLSVKLYQLARWTSIDQWLFCLPPDLTFKIQNIYSTYFLVLRRQNKVSLLSKA